MELREDVLHGVGRFVGIAQKHATEPRHPVPVQPVEVVVRGHGADGGVHHFDERTPAPIG
jgi:hypothetical protein